MLVLHVLVVVGGRWHHAQRLRVSRHEQRMRIGEVVAGHGGDGGGGGGSGGGGRGRRRRALLHPVVIS